MIRREIFFFHFERTKQIIGLLRYVKIFNSNDLDIFSLSASYSQLHTQRRQVWSTCPDRHHSWCFENHRNEAFVVWILMLICSEVMLFS